MPDLRSRLAAKYPEVQVWAAGGVIVRSAPEPEVAIVHRPGRHDWTYPKGKLEPGETLGRAAEREVLEETGFRCERIKRLPVVQYRDGRGRLKLVAYWLMEVIEGEFAPNPEVDALGWFDLTSAAAVLTYTRDATLLSALAPDDPPLRMLA